MVKMSKLPDDPGEGRTKTGAEGEVTAQPAGEPTGPAGERSQDRPAAQAPAPETAETPRERAKLAFASYRTGKMQIWTMHSSTGGSLTRITNRAYGAVWPAWVH